MVQFTTELYGRLQAGLQEINRVPATTLTKTEQSYNLCCSYLNELRDFMATYSFKDREDEVRFFKEIKPKFLREMLFYLKVFEVESHRPMTGTEDALAYYRQQLRETGGYIDRNQALYLYYKTERDHWDDKLFVQEPEGVPLLAPEYRYNEGASSNIFSFKLAKVQACEDLIVYLQGCIQDPGSVALKSQPAATSQPIAWKGTQSQFYELVLGVVKSGALGDVTIKLGMEWLGYCFGMQVGHFYRYIQVMRLRKKGRTPFLKKCAESAEAYMDECDEHPKYH